MRTHPMMRKTSRGFTLIEMMIVISIMLILISVAVPLYTPSVVRAREAVLKQNLHTLRDLIQQFTLDKHRAPASLEDLVSTGYVRDIPADITGSRETWVEVQEEVLLSVDQTQPGIKDVRSGSELLSSEGTTYREW